MQNLEVDQPFTIESGALCLEFANTLDWHASAHPVESITTYADLVQWAQQVGLLSLTEQQNLLLKAKAHAQEAATILAQAIELREAIYRIFLATAAKQMSQADDLALLNCNVQTALRHLVVTATATAFAWQWHQVEGALEQMLWPIAYSAAMLLTSDRLDRVKQCEDDRGCGFLFVDTSKNRARRWCSMESCGNRAKVRRHRQRA